MCSHTTLPQTRRGEENPANMGSVPRSLTGDVNSTAGPLRGELAAFQSQVLSLGFPWLRADAGRPFHTLSLRFVCVWDRAVSCCRLLPGRGGHSSPLLDRDCALNRTSPWVTAAHDEPFDLGGGLAACLTRPRRSGAIQPEFPTGSPFSIKGQMASGVRTSEATRSR